MQARELAIGAPPSIDDYFEGFIPAVCRVIGAITQYDGVVTASEYQTVVDASRSLASITDHPLLTNTMILHSILEPVGFSSALKQLSKEAKDQNADLREYVFESLAPLLAIQSVDDDKIVNAVAAALDIKEDSPDKGNSALGLFNGISKNFSSTIKNVFKRRTQKEKIRDFAITFNDDKLLDVVTAEIYLAEFSTELTNTIEISREKVIKSSIELEKNNRNLIGQDNAVNQLSNMADVMIEQIKRRLETIQLRSERQKKNFEDEMNVFLEDAALEATTVMKERMLSSDHTRIDVWDKFATSEAAGIIQRRYEKLKDRYDGLVLDWNQEYASFSNELVATQNSILSTLSRREFTELVPPVSIGFRVLGTVDAASTAVIGTAITGTAATAAAVGMGVLKAAAISSLVLTPVGLSLVGTVALAGLYKVVSRPDQRIRDEADNKVSVTISRLKEMLGDPTQRHNETMDELVNRFFVAAETAYAPIVRDAKLAVLYRDKQRKVIAEIAANTERYVENMLE